MEKSERTLQKFCSLPYDQQNFGKKNLDVPSKAHGQYFMLPSLPDNVYQKWQINFHILEVGLQVSNFLICFKVNWVPDLDSRSKVLPKYRFLG